jgi:hypothetical protein
MDIGETGLGSSAMPNADRTARGTDNEKRLNRI